jgi:hypothetical protein
MNVLYAGLENPVSVSASVSAEKTSISVSAGSQTKTGSGTYNITVPENLVGTTITITVNADIGGKQQAMGSKAFRVKRVPDPVAVLGGEFRGGKINKTDLLANPFVRANMGTDFAYDLTWTINSYKVTFITRGIEDAPMTNSGRLFSDAVKNKINASGTGTIIFFDDISATSVAGTRKLNPVTAMLK